MDQKMRGLGVHGSIGSVIHQRQRVARVEANGLFLKAENVLSYMIFAAGAITALFAIHLVFVSYSSLPHWDIWDTQIEYAAKAGSESTLHWLWKQENQHRLVIPKLFLLADLRWFHATQKFLLASILSIQLLHVAVLSWSMRVLGRWHGALWRTGTGVVAFCFFCPSQWENFVWGFQTCFVLPGFFASLSFVGLLLYWTHEKNEYSFSRAWMYLGWTVAGAIGASYSLSNGNLLWPLLTAAALLLRLRIAAVLTIVGAAILNAMVYLHSYSRPPGVISAVHTPIILIKYVAAYFGSSWVSYPEASSFPPTPGFLQAAEYIGTAALLLFVVVLLQLPSYIHKSRPFLVQLCLTLSFCVGTGLITGLARLGFGVVQSFSSHYQTISLLFWSCMALLLLGTVDSLNNMVHHGLLWTQIALIGVMVFSATLAPSPVRRARLRGFGLNAAAMALITEVPDYSQLRWAYPPNPGYVLSLVPLLREQRLSAFYEERSLLLGKPLDSVFVLASSNQCIGQLESVKTIADATSPSVRITGWVWDVGHHRVPSTIVATTDGIIAGVGATGNWRLDVRRTNAQVTADYSGFTGYVRDVRNRSSLRIFAILDRQPESACLFANAER
jgi:hypothetical protein